MTGSWGTSLDSRRATASLSLSGARFSRSSGGPIRSSVPNLELLHHTLGKKVSELVKLGGSHFGILWYNTLVFGASRPRGEFIARERCMNPVKNVTNRHHSLAALTAAISVRTLEGVDCRVPPRSSRYPAHVHGSHFPAGSCPATECLRRNAHLSVGCVR